MHFRIDFTEIVAQFQPFVKYRLLLTMNIDELFVLLANFTKTFPKSLAKTVNL